MKIKNDIKKLLKLIRENGSSIMTIISILIGFFALYISILSYKNANLQFEKNSISADSLFNVQLKNEKQLNDSLINQIQILQKITNNQLVIIDEQLKLSTQSYLEQLNSGRPKIIINSNRFNLPDGSLSQSINSFIETKFENIGLRPATKLNTRGFVVYKDLSFIMKNIDKDESILDPSKERVIEFYPKLNKEYIHDFYYCFEISYFDRLLDKTFIQSYYYHYHTLNEVVRFYNCNQTEKQKVKNKINELLDNLNYRLLID